MVFIELMLNIIRFIIKIKNRQVFGFLLIFPLTRKLILKNFSSKFKVKTKADENFIDGEYEDIEKKDDKKL